MFDTIQTIIRHTFEQRNFAHIWTPAVEQTDILLKGGETVANEIFGLVGLKDFQKGDIARATKSYALHFDLTVPFARYVMDHTGTLVFPFKRYQIQPVWRGERQQRGRFKEFRQCDVDTIWKSGTDVGYWYGVETIMTLQSALSAVFRDFNLGRTFTTHISHIGLTKRFLLTLLDRDTAKMTQVTELLDKFYKKDNQTFMDELTSLMGAKAQVVIDLIQTRDHTVLRELDGYEILAATLDTLTQLGCRVVYDMTIVRGLGYYTDIVFETFVDGDIALGSICSGGGYEDFTKFIDPKQLFSGIGGSIGLSRLMELVAQEGAVPTTDPSYLFLFFEDTKDAIFALYQRFLAQGKRCEMYPTQAKFGKQLEFADKR